MIEWTIENRTLHLIQGDIIQMDVDAVVNAANMSLILGGGVAGAIRQHGGPAIQKECNLIGPIRVGEAILTTGGTLKADFVIHAAGPVYGEGDEDIKLKSATLNCLKIAASKKFKSIVFPAISTGIFHFPIKRCSEIMLRTVLGFMKESEYPYTVVFCLFDKIALTVFQDTLTKLVVD
ncbi:MAG: macro domain-containing protein [Candidatus Aminicenantes bacterium]|nr:macro domain-containing protein [Candidatus Aminicenantes bacterium]